MYDINIELNNNYVCLESPLWDSEKKQLYLIDIAKNCIIEFDPISKKFKEYFFDFQPTALAKIKNKNGFVLSYIIEYYYITITTN